MWNGWLSIAPPVIKDECHNPLPDAEARCIRGELSEHSQPCSTWNLIAAPGVRRFQDAISKISGEKRPPSELSYWPGADETLGVDDRPMSSSHAVARGQNASVKRSSAGQDGIIGDDSLALHISSKALVMAASSVWLASFLEK